jgi:hypothetical protein
MADINLSHGVGRGPRAAPLAERRKRILKTANQRYQPGILAKGLGKNRHGADPVGKDHVRETLHVQKGIEFSRRRTATPGANYTPGRQ